MKVYTVMEHWCVPYEAEGISLVCIFSTRELADNYAKGRQSSEPEDGSTFFVEERPVHDDNAKVDTLARKA